MTEPVDADYQQLLARIESGDVRSIPGTLRQGQAAADVGQALLMEYTGTGSVAEAISVALGRPTKSAIPTTVMKTAMPEPLAERVRKLAEAQEVSAAQIVRIATAEYLDRMAA